MKLLLTILIVLNFFQPLAAQELSGMIDLDSEEEMEASALRGEIILETNEKKQNPYIAAQNASIEYFSELPTKLLALNKNAKALELPTDNLLNHTAYAYLYCSIKRGICKEFIDAVLEIDIANSAVQGKASCPAMKRFWKAWIANDMEKRHNYNVKTGFMRKTTMFKQQVLPKYLRCEKTIAELLENSGKDTISIRYQEGKGPIKTVNRVAAMLKSIKEKIPNLPEATK